MVSPPSGSNPHQQVSDWHHIYPPRGLMTWLAFTTGEDVESDDCFGRGCKATTTFARVSLMTCR